MAEGGNSRQEIFLFEFPSNRFQSQVTLKLRSFLISSYEVIVSAMKINHADS
jgi:hypothetical protein